MQISSLNLATRVVTRVTTWTEQGASSVWPQQCDVVRRRYLVAAAYWLHAASGACSTLVDSEIPDKADGRVSRPG